MTFLSVHYFINKLVLIVVFSGMILPAFAQETTVPITITTDKKAYAIGDVIITSGSVTERLSGYDVTMQVFSPNENLMSSLQLPVTDDNTFGTELIISGNQWISGTYTIKVFYGTATRTTQTTFDYEENNTVGNPAPNDQSTSEQTTEDSTNTEDLASKCGTGTIYDSSTNTCIVDQVQHQPVPSTNKILKLTSYENTIKVVVLPTTSVFDCGDLYITVFDIADDKKLAVRQGTFFDQCYGNSGTLPIDDQFSEKLDSGSYLIMAQLFDKNGDNFMTVSQDVIVQAKLVEFIDEPQVTCGNGLTIENDICVLSKSETQCGNGAILHNGICVDKKLVIDPKSESTSTPEITCITGTHKENGQCVTDKSYPDNMRNFKLQKGQWAKYDFTYNLKSDSSILSGIDNQFTLSNNYFPFNENYDSSTPKLIKLEISDITNSNYKLKAYYVKMNNDEQFFTEVIVNDSSDPFVINPDVEIGDKIKLPQGYESIVTEFSQLVVSDKQIDVIKATGNRIISKEGYVIEIKNTSLYHRYTGMLLLAESRLEGQFNGESTSALVRINAVDVSDHFTKKSNPISQNGCLIATAALDSELAPQVQLLREIRDNVLFNTGSGTTFMAGFNEFYYTFSPMVADLERQYPILKETVKIVIAPMLSTLSILNYVDINSEQQMLGYGTGIILLNIGVYFVVPILVIFKIRKIVKN